MGGRVTAESGGQGGRAPSLARRTGKPARRLPNAVAAARRLTEDQTREQLRLTEDEIAFLDRCASGRAPRNAFACIAAIKLKLDFTQPKPQQKIEHSGSVEITKIERVVVDAGGAK
jgi:hypothetical protein